MIGRAGAGITGNSPAAAYGHAGRGLLGESVPRGRGRRADRDAGDHARYMQNGPDWITALYDMDTACSPGVQRLRAVRLLRRTVRLARLDQLDRPLQLSRACS